MLCVIVCEHFFFLFFFFFKKRQRNKTIMVYWCMTSCTFRTICDCLKVKITKNCCVEVCASLTHGVEKKLSSCVCKHVLYISSFAVVGTILKTICECSRLKNCRFLLCRSACSSLPLYAEKKHVFAMSISCVALTTVCEDVCYISLALSLWILAWEQYINVQKWKSQNFAV